MRQLKPQSIESDEIITAPQTQLVIKGKDGCYVIDSGLM